MQSGADSQVTKKETKDTLRRKPMKDVLPVISSPDIHIASLTTVHCVCGCIRQRKILLKFDEAKDRENWQFLENYFQKILAKEYEKDQRYRHRFLS
jgi:predicted Fe-S protein YdhL (DUF1289 family)